MDGVRRLRVSSVRGEAFAAELVALARASWDLDAEFATVAKTAAGVSNAYQNVATMGVDRWLAILAAFAKTHGACCVLDCGSAMTFDWVDKNGGHRGGYIVPGLQLMRDVLAGKARALDVPLSDWREPVPGTSTADGIAGGILAMVSGFAWQCRTTVSAEAGGDVPWFLTGGDADVITRLLPWPHSLERDLVLDGLALVLP